MYFSLWKHDITLIDRNFLITLLLVDKTFTFLIYIFFT